MSAIAEFLVIARQRNNVILISDFSPFVCPSVTLWYIV